MKISLKEKILQMSIPEPNTGCWLWLGYICKKGYSKTGGVSGHHLSYIAFNGPVPEGKELDHKCRVTCCVNPDHLEPVTHAENIKRGNCPNREKTHCKYGHPFSGDNLRISKAGGRICVTCQNEYAKKIRLQQLTCG